MRDRPVCPIKIVHYLITPRPEKVVAHCLDLDLVATGSDEVLAEERLDAVVRAQIEGALADGNNVIFSHQAPDEYWQSFRKAKVVTMGTLYINVPQVVATHGELGVVRGTLTA